jgi:hypothetical protein
VELLPVRLAKACVSVLPVDAAGLSLHQIEFRVPIGASDEMATLAERLQFTQGEGPCLNSARTRRSVTVNAAQMQQDGPRSRMNWFAKRPIARSCRCRWRITPKTFAALDLYFVNAQAVTKLGLAYITEVTAQVAEALAAAVGTMAVATHMNDEENDEEIMPVWLDVAPARDRTYVWVAMGMVMSQFRLSATDAVAILRSFAYGHDRLLDDVALELVHGTLLLDQLQP